MGGHGIIRTIFKHYLELNLCWWMTKTRRKMQKLSKVHPCNMVWKGELTYHSHSFPFPPQLKTGVPIRSHAISPALLQIQTLKVDKCGFKVSLWVSYLTSLSLPFSHVKVNKNNPPPWFVTGLKKIRCKYLTFCKSGFQKGYMLPVENHYHHNHYYYYWNFYKKNLDSASVIIIIIF